MKTTLKGAVVLLMLLLQFQSNAQSSTTPVIGIYLNSNDFINHKLSYSSNEADRKNHLVFFSMFGSSNIGIVLNGVKTTLKKKDIFGYRDNGIDYRLFNSDAFAIIDTADFFLYGQEKEIRIMKLHAQKQMFYYFSLTPSSDIQALSKHNIENAFAYNKQFDHYLTTSFRSDEDLIAYDKRIKKYRLKYLYEEFGKMAP